MARVFIRNGKMTINFVKWRKNNQNKLILSYVFPLYDDEAKKKKNYIIGVYYVEREGCDCLLLDDFLRGADESNKGSGYKLSTMGLDDFFENGDQIVFNSENEFNSEIIIPHMFSNSLLLRKAMEKILKESYQQDFVEMMEARLEKGKFKKATGARFVPEQYDLNTKKES